MALIEIPHPLLTPDHVCEASTTALARTVHPMVRMGPWTDEPNLESCTLIGIAIVPGDRLFGTR